MHLELFSQQPEGDPQSAHPTPLLTEATIFPAMTHNMMLGNGWQDVADHMLRWLNERGL